VSQMEKLTFLELMLALTILAILAMIGINAFQKHLAKSKLHLAGRQIVADLAYYGNKAKLEGRHYTIFFNIASPNSYTISAPATSTLGAVKVVRTLSDGIACVAVNDADFSGCKSIRLTKQGMLAPYDVTLPLQNNSDKNSLSPT